MRSLLLLALFSFPFVAIAVDAPAPASTADAKAVNTVCVVCGNPVDAAVKPIAGKSADGKMVLIGCCSAKCAEEVSKSPDVYVDAAVQNQKFNSKRPAK